MLLSRVQPYVDVLMQHLSDLMVEADMWPDSVQLHLYSFWSDFDNLILLLPLPHLPIRETRLYLSRLWQELDSLEELTKSYMGVLWHLDRLKKALVYISHIVDEHLCGYFEFRSISDRTTEQVQVI